MKIRLVLIFLSLVTFSHLSVKANSPKTKKLTLTVDNNFLGKKYSEVKKLFPEKPTDFKCEEEDTKNCSAKLKSKCTCHETRNTDPELTVGTSEIIFVVHNDKIVEARQLYLMQDRDIDEKNNAYMVNKFETVAKAEPPADLYREEIGGMNNRAVTNSLFYYMAKWKPKSTHDMYAALRCRNKIDNGQMVLTTKVRDCWIKYFISSQIRTFEPLEDYKKVEFEY